MKLLVIFCYGMGNTVVALFDAWTEKNRWWPEQLDLSHAICVPWYATCPAAPRCLLVLRELVIACSHSIIASFFFSGRLLNNSLQVPLRRANDKCMWNWWSLLTCCYSKKNKNTRYSRKNRFVVTKESLFSQRMKVHIRQTREKLCRNVMTNTSSLD